MRLLYICAQWHALAKLRMHNDRTLQLLQYTTTWLGAQMRLFNHDTCSRITTKELQKESEARERREGKRKGTGEGTTTRKPVKFNMFTIKWHFLGDYVHNIQLFGTTDSYSTETVRRTSHSIASANDYSYRLALRTDHQGELFHRLPKSWFERTDKREFETQLSQIERRRSRLDHIRHANATCEKVEEPSSQAEGPREATEDGDSRDSRYTTGTAQNVPKAACGELQGGSSMHIEPPPKVVEEGDSPDRRYTIGTNQNSPLDIACFSHNSDMAHNDPYVVVSLFLCLRVVSRAGSYWTLVHIEFHSKPQGAPLAPDPQ